MEKYCGMNHKLHSGMTMTELLAAVSILIVLILILTGVVKSTYKKVEAVQCANNLKELGMAIQLYSNDYDYQLVPPGRTGSVTWARNLINCGYVPEGKTKIFSCPSLIATKTYRLNSGNFDGTYWEHADEGEGGQADFSSMEKPGETILLSEFQNTSMNTGIDSNDKDTYSDSTMWSGSYPTKLWDALLYVHHGGSNYLFADFHVDWIDGDEIKNDPNNYIKYDKP